MFSVYFDIKRRHCSKELRTGTKECKEKILVYTECMSVCIRLALNLLPLFSLYSVRNLSNIKNKIK